MEQENLRSLKNVKFCIFPRQENPFLHFLPSASCSNRPKVEHSFIRISDKTHVLLTNSSKILIEFWSWSSLSLIKDMPWLTLFIVIVCVWGILSKKMKEMVRWNNEIDSVTWIFVNWCPNWHHLLNIYRSTPREREQEGWMDNCGTSVSFFASFHRFLGFTATN